MNFSNFLILLTLINFILLFIALTSLLSFIIEVFVMDVVTTCDAVVITLFVKCIILLDKIVEV